VTSVAPVTLNDGRVMLATGSRDNTVRLWDPNTHETKLVLPLLSEPRAICTLSPGRFAIAHGGGALVVDEPGQGPHPAGARAI